MPTLTDLDASVAYGGSTVGTPQLIDTSITVTDVEEDWGGGTIVISGLLPNDTLTIRSTGTGPGEISVSGIAVFYEGVNIGFVTGGVGGDLTITPFGSNMTNTALEALLEALEFSASTLLVTNRTLTYTLTDGAANSTSETITLSIVGDAGANTLKGTAGADTIDGAGGNDFLRGEDDADILVGAAGNDTLAGGAGADTLDGGADNDTLNGGVGADSMDGGTGNDLYVVDDAGDQVLESPGEGTDTVRSYLSNYTLTAEVENLVLMTVAVEGHGNTDNNTITGNAIDNDLYGENGDDTLNGLAGEDYLEGGSGVDTLNGGNDADILSGGADNDILRGGAGNDTLNGESGADDMDGGTGNDIYYVDDAGDVVGEVTPNGGVDEVRSLVSFTLAADIEGLTLLGTDDLAGTGSAGTNVIQGNDGENVLSGLGGNDVLNGGAGADDLLGGAGRDTLDGGTGDDTLAGGTEDDTYYVDSFGDVVIENVGEGYDRIYTTGSFTLDSGASVEEVHVVGSTGRTLRGNGNNDRLFGDVGGDVLIGGGGDDRLDGGAGADEMEGGEGNDTYFVDNQNDLIFENFDEGVDIVKVTLANYYASDNIEHIYGLSSTGQRLGGNSLDNRIEGGAGNDVLGGGDGDDILIGGLGADRLNGTAGNDSMRGGDGDDTYWVDAYDQIVENANEGVDTIYTVVDWTIDDNVENLIMSGTDDLVAGGNALNNVITGNVGWNDLYGDDGDDTLNGGAGDDLLVGEDGEDTLNGGSGDDTLDGGEGADHMFGGTGNDSYIVDNLGDTTQDVGGLAGIDLVVASVSHTIGASIEILYLAPGAGNIDGTGNSTDNLIQGNEGDNVLSGMAGRDALNGDEGEDILYGGDGDDFLDDGFDTDVDYLYGGAGHDMLVGSDGDYLYGGIGNDEYSITEEGINVVEYGGEGYDTVYSQISYTLTDNVEKLDLNCAGGDIDGTGSALANTILGNCHTNILDGAAGNDVLEGGEGDDILIGGLGNDRMTGGDDADTFVIRNDDMVFSALAQVRQADIILDLDFSEGDRIDLSDIDADSNTLLDEDFVFVSAFNKQAGQAVLKYNSTTDQTSLQLDVDGDGKADYHLTMYGDQTGGTLLDGSEPAGDGGWLGFVVVT